VLKRIIANGLEQS